MSEFVYLLTMEDKNYETPIVVRVFRHKPSYLDLYEAIVGDVKLKEEHFDAIYESRDNTLNSTKLNELTSIFNAIYELRNDALDSTGPSELIPVNAGDDIYYLSAQRLYENW